jgi:large subunit ribosomal protein L23
MENIIIKPLITEKATRAGEKFQQFGFIVQPGANKLEVKAAVEKRYGVSVTGVTSMNYIGKKSVRYTKKGFSKGKKNYFKKVFVTLKEGESIDFFANI